MREYHSFFKTVSGNEGNKCHYPTRLDTYGQGCQHNCSYCYARVMLSIIKQWNAADPAVADPAKVTRTINRKLHSGDVVRLGGLTDCFQPMEKEHRATLHAIEELNKRDVHYLIVTKSAIVADEEYLSAMRKDLAHIQVTVTCTDDEYCSRYERASAPSERLKAIERLYDNGFDVTLRLSPFVPQFVSTGVLDMDLINGCKYDKILVEFLRVNRNNMIKKWFDIDYSEYTLLQHGNYHLPLERKKEYIKLLSDSKVVSVCEDETEAYDYWQHNFNPNPNDCCNLSL